MVYLAEAAVIGALNVPKMLVVALFGERIDSFRQLQQAGSRFALTYMLLVGYVAGFAVVVIAAKILVDWKAHQAERRRLQAARASPSPLTGG
jgi:hypothetical protein